MIRNCFLGTVILTVIFTFCSVASAAELMPDFSGVPTGWVTDRFQPNGFSNVGSFAGRDDVLGIEINTAEGFGSRGGCCNSTFYNTQGMQFAVFGFAGDTLSADLYVPLSWADEVNGSRRTDMWGVMTDGSSVTDYPIIGFTNFGGTPLFRVWDDVAWSNLSTSVIYDDWTSFQILFTGSAYEYRINGNLVYTDTTINGSTGFQAAIMQAYNFNGDPSLVGAVAGDPLGNYTAHWDNPSEVPEPGTLALVTMGFGLIGLGGWRRRKMLL